MADRFPSLDEFDAGQTEPSTSTEPSNFLARERAALGDDANLFGSSTDNTTTGSATVADAADEEDDDDLLGGGMGSTSTAQHHTTNGDDGDMMDDFESSFPSMDTSNEAVAPGGTITGSGLPYRPPTHPDSHQNNNGYTVDSSAEPAVISEWRERRDASIQKRDEASASRKSETIAAAQQAIDDFYENYNSRKDKTVAATRKEAEEFLNGREDTTSGGTSWERIAKLVDLSGKGSAGGAAGTGKARMREMLLGLRKDEGAPGAKGY
ncbi:Clathrin light chain [Friedmanniomyces endolithicus]|nr:Clathrin light chain [Friedmanniomyces endolithicus]